jgi:hypothetical protein
MRKVEGVVRGGESGTSISPAIISRPALPVPFGFLLVTHYSSHVTSSCQEAA